MNVLSQEISACSGGEVNTLKRQTAKGTSNSRSATKTTITTITTTTKNFKQTTHQFTTIEITVPHKCIRLGCLVPW